MPLGVFIMNIMNITTVEKMNHEIASGSKLFPWLSQKWNQSQYLFCSLWWDHMILIGRWRLLVYPVLVDAQISIFHWQLRGLFIHTDALQLLLKNQSHHRGPFSSCCGAFNHYHMIDSIRCFQQALQNDIWFVTKPFKWALHEEYLMYSYIHDMDHRN